MKQIEKLSESKNYTAVDLGDLKSLMDYFAGSSGK